MQATLFILARLKKVTTLKNLYHTQFQCVDKLRSLVWMNSNIPSLTVINQAGHALLFLSLMNPVWTN